MNLLMETKFGSYLYGTDTPESDLDIKGIYIPTLKEILLHQEKDTVEIKRNKAACERNTKDDIDIEIFSVKRYLQLLTQGQTVALDMLFSNIANGDYVWEAIRQNKHEFLNKNVAAFIGYARQQAAKYGIKGSRMDALKETMLVLETLPPRSKLGEWSEKIEHLVERSKELISLENSPLIEIIKLPGPDKMTLAPHLHVCGRKVPYGATVEFAKKVFGKILDGYGERARKAHLDGGIDWKALSHAVRVNSEGVELLLTGNITFPRPDRELLLKIKKGEMQYEQVAEIIEGGLVNIVNAQEESALRDKPNLEFMDKFLYDLYVDLRIVDSYNGIESQFLI